MCLCYTNFVFVHNEFDTVCQINGAIRVLPCQHQIYQVFQLRLYSCHHPINKQQKGKKNLFTVLKTSLWNICHNLQNSKHFDLVIKKRFFKCSMGFIYIWMLTYRWASWAQCFLVFTYVSNVQRTEPLSFFSCNLQYGLGTTISFIGIGFVYIVNYGALYQWRKFHATLLETSLTFLY